MVRATLLFLLIMIPASQEAISWPKVLDTWWQEYKALYIFCGVNCGNNSGLVYDPSANYHAVSEGVGYGLLMAVTMNDQPTFDAIYNAAQLILLDAETGLFHWRANNLNEITGRGSATDADQDVAFALILAQKRVDRGEWGQQSYGERAEDLLDAIWTYAVVDGRYLKPGNYFGGDGQEIINLSYFAPAWYRIFNTFQNTDRWSGLIDQGYTSLYSTQGSALGLAPDWSTYDGQPATPFCEREGITPDTCAYEMGYDAIRVPWRVGLDCLWFNDTRACEWSERSVNFLRALPSSQQARMYDLSGSTIVDYQDEAMVGMWLVAAVAGKGADLQLQLERQLSQQDVQSPFYFNRSLAWFGAAVLSGDFQELAALNSHIY